jgi:hypothetical protein
MNDIVFVDDDDDRTDSAYDDVDQILQCHRRRRRQCVYRTVHDVDAFEPSNNKYQDRL